MMLIATDGSEFTNAATARGLALARTSGAEVTALFAVDYSAQMHRAWSSTIPSGRTGLGSAIEGGRTRH
jgi:nucleotide-binding universal stress UspA family protein